jgi:hypothetical protein
MTNKLVICSQHSACSSGHSGEPSNDLLAGQGLESHSNPKIFEVEINPIEVVRDHPVGEVLASGCRVVEIW